MHVAANTWNDFISLSKHRNVLNGTSKSVIILGAMSSQSVKLFSKSS